MVSALLGLALALNPESRLGVVYRTVGAEELKMDVYAPAGEGPFPAVVVIHGGAWMGGKRDDMAELSRLLAGRGFVAATVSYRLAPRSIWPAMWDDVQAATRHLRANAAAYRIDPKRIGAAGASAGGHLALLLGFTDTRDAATTDHPKESSRVSAVLNIFGPTDLRRDYGESYDLMYQVLLRKPRKDAAAEIESASPIAHLGAGDAAVFTLHGTADPVVPFAQATWLDESMKSHGIPHETAFIDGMGHELPLQDPRVMEALNRGVDFLARRLGAKAPAAAR